MGAKMFTPYDLRPTIKITEYSLAGASTLIIAIRLYTRRWVVGRLQASDYTMAIAVMFAWGLCVCNYYQLLFGTGTRAPAPFEPDSTIEQKEALMKYWKFGSAVSWFSYHIGYLFIMTLIKLSILLFYLSFATRRTFRKVVQIAIILVTVLSALKIFIVAFQCPRTPWYAFSPAILEHRGAGHCFDLRVVFYWQAAWNLGTDVVILLLPMPVLFSIRMETTKRFSVVAVFAVSLLIPIASAVRLWALNLWAESGEDGRYYGGYIIFWSQVEIHTAIICASAPSIQPLLKRMYRSATPTKARSPNYYYEGHNGQAMPPFAALRPCVHRGSISLLEAPTRAHVTHTANVYGKLQRNVFIIQNLENISRTRMHAFATPSAPSHLIPSPSQRPENLREGD